MPAQNPDNKGKSDYDSSEKSAGVLRLIQSKIPLLNNKSSSFFLFILASTVCIIVIVLFIIGLPQKVYYKNLSPKNLTTNATNFSQENLFSNPNEFSKYQEYLNLKTADGYLKAFSLLSNEYTFEHSSEKRDVLVKLAKYISVNFPSEAGTTNLNVPCYEESCGEKIELNEDLAKIKESIQNNTDINDFEKQVLILNLDNAAIAKSKNNKIDEFNGLSIAFQQLKSKYAETKSVTIRTIAKNLLKLIEQTDKNGFDFGVSRGTFVI